ncbi:MAG: hypothetical protein KCHDKBKB_00916 [Elusimicrobia bacterium]|nr:hypothetical protein [Elusimicrobiota bacterium]
MRRILHQTQYFLSSKKSLALLLAGVMFVEMVAVPLAEANQYEGLWAERKKQIQKSELKPSSQQLASLPDSFSHSLIHPTQLLDQKAMARSGAWSSPENSAVRNRFSHYSQALQSLLKSVPLSHSTVKEIFDVPSAPAAPVVLVQDIHLNPEAQGNIAKVLASLIDEKKVGTIGVEGAFGDYDFSPFHAFDEKKIVEEVSRDFLESGYLSAPSYVGLNRLQTSVRFVGVDDPKSYEANVKAYLSTREMLPAVERNLGSASKSLAKKKTLVFTPALQEFDGLRAAYDHGQIGLGVYAKKLAAMGGEVGFELERFLLAHQMESSLDFSRVDQERKSVIEKLVGGLGEKEAKTLLQQSVAYRLGHMSYGDYYRQMRETCQKNGIDLSKTPAFDNYIRYVLLSDGLSAEKLFREVGELEKDVLKQMALTPEQEKLIAQSEFLALAGKLVKFELTPEEWGSYKATVHGPWTMDYGPNLSSFERFYEAADLRSHKMIRNLLTQIPKPKVLVAGGFHTELLTGILKQERIPYVVVAPKITKISDEAGSAYLSVFAREKTPLEKMFAGEKLFVSPNNIHAGSKGTFSKPLTLVLLAVISASIFAASGILKTNLGITVFPEALHEGLYQVQMALQGEVPLTLFVGFASVLSHPSSVSREFQTSRFAVWFTNPFPSFVGKVRDKLSIVRLPRSLSFTSLKEALRSWTPSFVGVMNMPILRLALSVPVWGALAYFVLPYASEWMGHLASILSQPGSPYWLQAAVWGGVGQYLFITANIVMFLTFITVGIWMVSRTKWGQAMLKPLVGFYESHKKNSFWHHVFDLGFMFYGFGFKPIVNVLQIAQGEKIENPNLLEQTYARAPPLVQMLLLPFVASLSIVAARFKLLFYSYISKIILLAVLTSLIGPNGTSLLMHFNLLDLVFGAGWAGPLSQIGGMTGAAVQFFSVFGLLSSYMLQLVMGYFARAKEIRQKDHKDSPLLVRWTASFLEALPSIFWRIPTKDAEGKVVAWRWPLLVSSLSFIKFGGLHWVSLEIEFLKWLSLPFAPIHAVVMSVEDHERGVMGAAHLMEKAILPHLGVNPDLAIHQMFGLAPEGKTALESREDNLFSDARFESRELQDRARLEPSSAEVGAGPGGGGGGAGGGDGEGRQGLWGSIYQVARVVAPVPFNLMEALPNKLINSTLSLATLIPGKVGEEARELREVAVPKKSALQIIDQWESDTQRAMDRVKGDKVSKEALETTGLMRISPRDPAKDKPIYLSLPKFNRSDFYVGSDGRAYFKGNFLQGLKAQDKYASFNFDVPAPALLGLESLKELREINERRMRDQETAGSTYGEGEEIPENVLLARDREEAAVHKAFASILLADNRMSLRATKGQSLVSMVDDGLLKGMLERVVPLESLRNDFKTGRYDVKMVTLDPVTGKVRHVYAHERISSLSNWDRRTNHMTQETYAESYVKIDIKTGQVTRDPYPASGLVSTILPKPVDGVKVEKEEKWTTDEIFNTQQFKWANNEMYASKLMGAIGDSNILPKTVDRVKVEKDKKWTADEILNIQQFKRANNETYAWMLTGTTGERMVLESRVWKPGIDLETSDIALVADNAILGNVVGMTLETFREGRLDFQRIQLRSGVSDDVGYMRYVERLVSEIPPTNIMGFLAAAEALKTIDTSTVRGRMGFHQIQKAWDFHEKIFQPIGSQGEIIQSYVTLLKSLQPGFSTFDPALTRRIMDELVTMGRGHPKWQMIYARLTQKLANEPQLKKLIHEIGDIRGYGPAHPWFDYMMNFNYYFDRYGPGHPVNRADPLLREELEKKSPNAQQLRRRVFDSFTYWGSGHPHYQAQIRYWEELEKQKPNWTQMRIMMNKYGHESPQVQALIYGRLDGYGLGHPLQMTASYGPLWRYGQNFSKVQTAAEIQNLLNENGKFWESLKALPQSQGKISKNNWESDPALALGLAAYRGKLSELKNQMDQHLAKGNRETFKILAQEFQDVSRKMTVVDPDGKKMVAVWPGVFAAQETLEAEKTKAGIEDKGQKPPRSQDALSAAYETIDRLERDTKRGIEKFKNAPAIAQALETRGVIRILPKDSSAGQPIYFKLPEFNRSDFYTGADGHLYFKGKFLDEIKANPKYRGYNLEAHAPALLGLESLKELRGFRENKQRENEMLPPTDVPEEVHIARLNFQAAQHNALASALLIDNRLSVHATKDKSLIHFMGEKSLEKIIPNEKLRNDFKQGRFNVVMVTKDPKSGKIRHVYANERIASHTPVDRQTNSATKETYSASFVKIDLVTGKIERDKYPASSVDSSLLPLPVVKVKIDPKENWLPREYLSIFKFERENGDVYAWMPMGASGHRMVLESRVWKPGVDLDTSDIVMVADSGLLGNIAGMINESFHWGRVGLNRIQLREGVSDDPEYMRLVERVIAEIPPGTFVSFLAMVEALKTIDVSTERGRQGFERLKNAWDFYPRLNILKYRHVAEIRQHIALLKSLKPGFSIYDPALRGKLKSLPQVDEVVTHDLNSLPMYTPLAHQKVAELIFPSRDMGRPEFFKPFDVDVSGGDPNFGMGHPERKIFDLLLDSRLSEVPNLEKLVNELSDILELGENHPLRKNQQNLDFDRLGLTQRAPLAKQIVLHELSQENPDASRMRERILNLSKAVSSANAQYLRRYWKELNNPSLNWRQVVAEKGDWGPGHPEFKTITAGKLSRYGLNHPDQIEAAEGPVFSPGSPDGVRLRAIQQLTQGNQEFWKKLNAIPESKSTAGPRDWESDPALSRGLAVYRQKLSEMENQIKNLINEGQLDAARSLIQKFQKISREMSVVDPTGGKKVAVVPGLWAAEESLKNIEKKTGLNTDKESRSESPIINIPGIRFPSEIPAPVLGLISALPMSSWAFVSFLWRGAEEVQAPGKTGKVPPAAPDRPVLRTRMDEWSDRHRFQGWPQSNIAGDPQINGVAFLYDLAMEAQRFISAAQLTDAKVLLRTIGRTWWPSKGGFIDSFNLKRNEPLDYAQQEVRVTNGPNMHLALSSLTVWAADKGNDAELFQLAKSIGEFVLKQQKADGGIPYGPEPQKFDNGVSYQADFNCEYQINAYALFHRLALITGEVRWEQAAERALDYLIRHHYDPVQKEFWDTNTRGQRGTPPDVPGWALSMVGPEKLAAKGVDIEALVNDLGEIPSFFVTEWLINQMNGLKKGIQYLERAQKTAQAANAKNKLQDLEDIVRRHLPLQPAEKGAGLAYAYTKSGDKWVSAEGVDTLWGHKTQQGSSLVSATAVACYARGHDPVAGELKGQPIPWESFRFAAKKMAPLRTDEKEPTQKIEPLKSKRDVLPSEAAKAKIYRTVYKDDLYNTWTAVINRATGKFSHFEIFDVAGRKVAHVDGQITVNGVPVTGAIRSLGDKDQIEAGGFRKSLLNANGAKEGEELYVIGGDSALPAKEFYYQTLKKLQKDQPIETASSNAKGPDGAEALSPQSPMIDWVAMKEKEGESYLAGYSVPTPALPDAVLLQKRFDDGRVEVHSKHVFSPEAAEWISGRVEIYRFGKLYRTREIELDPKGQIVKDAEGRPRFITKYLQADDHGKVMSFDNDSMEVDGQVVYMDVPRKDDLSRKERIIMDLEKQRSIFHLTRKYVPIPKEAYALNPDGTLGDKLATFTTRHQIENKDIKLLQIRRDNADQTWMGEEYREAPEKYEDDLGQNPALQLKKIFQGKIENGNRVTQIIEQVYYENEGAAIPEDIRNSAQASGRQNSPSDHGEIGRQSFVYENGTARKLGHSVKHLSVDSFFSNDADRSLFSGTVPSERFEWGYNEKKGEYVRRRTIEFYNGLTLVGRIDWDKGVLSVKRTGGEYTVDPTMPNREKAGWDEYRFLRDGKDVSTGHREELGLYSVDALVPDVLAQEPPELADARAAFQVYQFEPKDKRFHWKQSALLDSRGVTLAEVKKDPLYFSPDKQVIDLIDYKGSFLNKMLGTVEGRQTYLFDPKTKTINFQKDNTGQNVPIGTAVRVDPASLLNFSSKKEVQDLLDRPEVMAFKITDKRNAHTFIDFFDNEHGDKYIARIEGSQGQERLLIPSYDENLVSQGENAYELNNKDVGQKTDRTRINKDAALRQSLISQLKDDYPVLAKELENAVAYDIEPLYPSGDDGVEHPRKTRTAYFRNHQLLAEIDWTPDKEKLNLNFYDEGQPWVNSMGLVMSFANKQMGRVLSMSVVVNHGVDSSIPGTQAVHVLDAGMGASFIEYRSKYGVEARDEGSYLATNTKGDVLKDENGQPLVLNLDQIEIQDLLRRNEVLAFIKSGQVEKARERISRGYQGFARLNYIYKEWNGFSASHLRALGVAFRTEAHLFTPKNNGNNGEPETKAASTSELTGLEMVPGKGMRIETFRHCDSTYSGDPLETDQKFITDEEGRKKEILYGGSIGNTFEQRRDNFKCEKHFFAFVGPDMGPNYIYNIADKTLTLNVDPKTGQRTLFQKANSTEMIPRGILYKTQRGISFAPLVYPDWVKDDFDKFKYLQQQVKTISFDALTLSYVEVKNERGELTKIISGFEESEIGPDGYVKNIRDGKYINFLNYSMLLDLASLWHESISEGSDIFVFKPGQLDRSSYSDADFIGSLSQLKFRKDQNGYYMAYEAKDRREGGALLEVAVTTFGTPKYIEWKGMPGEPDRIRLVYNANGLPAYCLGITGDRQEIWRTFSHATVRAGQDRYLVIRENDPARSWFIRLLYPAPGWIVYKNGVVMAKEQEGERRTVEYRAEWSFKDNILNSLGLRFFLKAQEIAEAEKIIAIAERDKLFSDASLPADVKINAWARMERFLFLSQIVALIVAALTAFGMFMWRFLTLTVRRVEINRASAEQLEQVFSHRAVARIVTYRNQVGVIQSFDEIVPLLREDRHQYVNFEAAMKSLRKKVVFRSRAPDALTAENLKVLLDTPREALPQLQAQMDNFIGLNLLTQDQINGLVRTLAGKLSPHSVSQNWFERRILRDMFRAAYWDERGAMKPQVRASLRSEIALVFDRVGLPLQGKDQFDNTNYVDGLIEIISKEIPMDAMDLPEPVMGQVTGPSFFVPNQQMGWKTVSLEEYVIQNAVIPRIIGYIDSNYPVVKWLTREIQGLLMANNTPAQIQAFINRHEQFWYQVLKDQHMRLESNRDMRRVAQAYVDDEDRRWEFLLTWEDLNDAFRFYMGESELETDGRLPQRFMQRPEYTEARGQFDLLLKRIGLGVYQAPNNAKNNLSSDLIQSIVNQHMQPMVENVRMDFYRFPDVRAERGEWKLLGVVLKYVLDRRFWRSGWGPLILLSSVLVPVGAVAAIVAGVPLGWVLLGAAVYFGPLLALLLLWLSFRSLTLKEKRASFHWGYSIALSMAFATFVSVFIFYQIIFMPIPVSVASLMLGWWTKPLLIVLSLSVLPDMYVLTYFGITNVLKGFVRVGAGQNYNFAQAQSFSTSPAWGRAERVFNYVMLTLGVSSLFVFGFNTMTYVLVTLVVWIVFMAIRNAKPHTLGAVQLLPKLFEGDFEKGPNEPQYLEMFEINVNGWAEETWLSPAEYREINGAIQAAKQAKAANNLAGYNQAVQNIQSAVKKIKAKRTQGYIQDWVNTFFRNDMPPAPTNNEELRSVSYQLAGFGENGYVMYNLFNKLDGAAKQTQLGMLAVSYPEEFQMLLDKMKDQGLINAAQLTELELLKKKPNHILTTFVENNSDHAPAIATIEHWFNMRSQTIYANFMGALNARKTYAYYLKKFNPEKSAEEIEGMARKKVQIVVIHTMVAKSMVDFLRGVFANDPRYQGLSLNEYRDLISKNIIQFPPNGTNGVNLAPFPNSGDYNSYRKYMELMVKHDIGIYYGARTGKADIHMEKYQGWMHVLKDLRGELVIANDFDMRLPIHEAWGVPCIGREFDMDPRLGVAVYTGDIFTKPLSPQAFVMATMEEGWLWGEQPTKREVGALEAYGKFVFRRSMIRYLEGLPDHYVAEDAKTAERVLLAGGRTTHLTYYKPGKGLSNQWAGSLNPLRKWSGDAPESVYGPIFSKLMYSPHLHWTVKLDALMSYGFYLKKPSVVRVTSMVLIIFYFLNLNPWFGLPYLSWVVSLIISQAIGYGALMLYVDRKGWWKGAAQYYFWDLPFKIFPFATAITPQYADAVQKGIEKKTQFLKTGGKGGPLERMTFDQLYYMMQYTIIRGVVLTLMVVFLSNFDPLKFVIWLPQILTVSFGWWIGPFYFNPTFSWKDRQENLAHILLAVKYVFLDLLNNLPSLIKVVTVPFITFVEIIGEGLLPWVGIDFGKRVARRIKRVVPHRNIPSFTRMWGRDQKIYRNALRVQKMSDILGVKGPQNPDLAPLGLYSGWQYPGAFAGAPLGTGYYYHGLGAMMQGPSWQNPSVVHLKLVEEHTKKVEAVLQAQVPNLEAYENAYHNAEREITFGFADVKPFWPLKSNRQMARLLRQVQGDWGHLRRQIQMEWDNLPRERQAQEPKEDYCQRLMVERYVWKKLSRAERAVLVDAYIPITNEERTIATKRAQRDLFQRINAYALAESQLKIDRFFWVDGLTFIENLPETTLDANGNPTNNTNEELWATPEALTLYGVLMDVNNNDFIQAKQYFGERVRSLKMKLSGHASVPALVVSPKEPVGNPGNIGAQANAGLNGHAPKVLQVIYQVAPVLADKYKEKFMALSEGGMSDEQAQALKETVWSELDGKADQLTQAVPSIEEAKNLLVQAVRSVVENQRGVEVKEKSIAKKSMRLKARFATEMREIIQLETQLATLTAEDDATQTQKNQLENRVQGLLGPILEIEADRKLVKAIVGQVRAEDLKRIQELENALLAKSLAGQFHEKRSDWAAWESAVKEYIHAFTELMNIHKARLQGLGDKAPDALIDELIKLRTKTKFSERVTPNFLQQVHFQLLGELKIVFDVFAEVNVDEQVRLINIPHATAPPLFQMDLLWTYLFSRPIIEVLFFILIPLSQILVTLINIPDWAPTVVWVLSALWFSKKHPVSFQNRVVLFLVGLAVGFPFWNLSASMVEAFLRAIAFHSAYNAAALVIKNLSPSLGRLVPYASTNTEFPPKEISKLITGKVVELILPGQYFRIGSRDSSGAFFASVVTREGKDLPGSDVLLLPTTKGEIPQGNISISYLGFGTLDFRLKETDVTNGVALYQLPPREEEFESIEKDRIGREGLGVVFRNPSILQAVEFLSRSKTEGLNWDDVLFNVRNKEGRPDFTAVTSNPKWAASGDFPGSKEKYLKGLVFAVFPQGPAAEQSHEIMVVLPNSGDETIRDFNEESRRKYNRSLEYGIGPKLKITFRHVLLLKFDPQNPSRFDREVEVILKAQPKNRDEALQALQREGLRGENPEQEQQDWEREILKRLESVAGPKPSLPSLVAPVGEGELTVSAQRLNRLFKKAYGPTGSNEEIIQILSEIETAQTLPLGLQSFRENTDLAGHLRQHRDSLIDQSYVALTSKQTVPAFQFFRSQSADLIKVYYAPQSTVRQEIDSEILRLKGQLQIMYTGKVIEITEVTRELWGSLPDLQPVDLLQTTQGPAGTAVFLMADGAPRPDNYHEICAGLKNKLNNQIEIAMLILGKMAIVNLDIDDIQVLRRFQLIASQA